jgi:DNA repair protein SbcC/Rad50
VRPHHLRFCGIGAYPDQVEINFDDLNTMGLYVIVGPTGAGKTTILDAMTYALYGRVAEERANAIVSTYPNSKPAVIEFEFSHGNRRYVVHREPTPQGKVTSPNKQWIKEFDLSGNELNVVTGTAAVTNKSKSVVGLSPEEFMQIILLPQGKFKEFLVATGKAKQEVLKTIFGTGSYRRLIERLKANAEELRDEVRAIARKDDNQKAVIKSSVQTLRQHMAFHEMPDPEIDLDLATAFIATKVAELDGTEKRARDLHAQLTSDFTQATNEAERFDKGTRLNELRTTQNTETEAANSARVKISDHQRAQPVVEAADMRDVQTKQLAELELTVSEARTTLREEAQQLHVSAEATRAFCEAVPLAPPVTLSTELTKLRTRLDTASKDFQTLADIDQRITTAGNNIVKFTTNIDELMTTLADAKTTTERTAMELSSARQQIKGLPDAASELAKLEDLLSRSDVDAATSVLETATNALSVSRDAFDVAEGLLRAAQDTRTRELAGALAEELEPGESCPVCGSTEHPKKAAITAGETYDLEAIETARDAANRTKIEDEQNVKLAETALDTAQSNRSLLPTPDEQDTIRSTHQNLRTIENSIEDLEARADLASGLVVEIERTLIQYRQELAEDETTKKALLEQLNGLEKSVTTIGSADQVKKALSVCKNIEALLQRLDKDFGELTTCIGRHDQATDAFHKALAASGFDNESLARTRLLDSSSLEELKQLVSEFETRQRDIDRLEAAVGDAPLPSSRPEVADIQSRLDAANSSVTAVAAVAGDARSNHGQIQNARAEIARLGPEIAEKKKQAAKADEIASTFDKGSGGEDGNGQFGLEVWIQRAMFKEVCLVANEQLAQLSSERYSLTLEREEGGVKKIKGGGLDLYVFDSHTGTTRPVQTLSGGETFLASLALALALAEVVQRHSGGIELPCLFIDEGFGTLDEAILDITMEVLGQIQATGRTVGIITHVKPMHDQLQIGIKVRKTDRGSTLEVVAGRA